MIGRSTTFAAAALLAACGSDETSILLVIESDLVVPDEIDAVRVVAQGEEERSDATYSLVGAFPESVLIRAGKDRAGPVDLDVTGLLRGAGVARAAVASEFREGEQVTATVRLDPCRDCTDGGIDAGPIADDAGADGGADSGVDGGSIPDSAVDASVPETLPSNVPAESVPLPGEREDVMLDASTTWNTETGEITAEGGVQIRAAGEGVASGIGFAVVEQAGGPALGVFTVGRLELPEGVVLSFAGANAAVILATGDVEVAGRVSLAAAGQAAGPGGGAAAGDQSDSVAAGTGAGANGRDTGEPDSGGGGGGFGGVGGEGGRPVSDLQVIAGGVAYGDASLVPLLAGSGGGSGAWTESARSVHGGGGGGALQIFSRISISVAASGVITAAGAGGGGAPPADGAGVGGGGGGGSGGGILLEAPVIQIDGAVAANGGGGGSGGSAPLAGADGEGGRDDAQPAAGAEPAANEGGAGGAGGAGESAAGPGAEALNAGGGGGGVGRIRLNTLTGEARIAGTLSPDPSLGLVATP